jgi:hypothetical protein
MTQFLELMSEMFTPSYWVTVVPVGLAILGSFAYYDENLAPGKADLDDA